MNSKERVMCSFGHKEADYVPLFEPWIENEIIKQLGKDPINARLNLGLDCIPLGTHPYNTNAYKNGIDEWGRIFVNGDYGGGVVSNWKNLEKYSAPLSHSQDWFPESQVKSIKNSYGEDYALYFGWHDCSLGLSYMSLGMEKFFLKLYDDLDFVKAVISRSTEWTIALVEQANTAGADFIILGDDAADNNRPMISPKMFSDLIVPEYKKITKASNIPILWHSDGNIEPLLPYIIEAGFVGVHSLESKAGIDLEKIKRKFGHKLVLAGNIDTTNVLCQSDKAIIRKEVERAIKQGAIGGGYLFSSSNSLFKGHNLQSILEMYRHAKKFGKYPIG